MNVKIMKFYAGIILVQVLILHALLEKLVHKEKFYVLMEPAKIQVIVPNQFLEIVQKKNLFNVLISIV